MLHTLKATNPFTPEFESKSMHIQRVALKNHIQNAQAETSIEITPNPSDRSRGKCFGLWKRSQAICKSRLICKSVLTSRLVIRLWTTTKYTAK